ncbi:MAG TPA: MFS transporter [Candidatus Avirikenella pullistercoris]|nr:MFS transporter [Candidatus Avirikenella pullistercoris]
MLCGYIITDVMAPLKTMLEQELNWTSSEYGLFTSGYGWLNVFVFMLIISGIILDKMGVRFTGISATLVMLIGTSIKYWAISTTFENNIITIGNWFSINKQVLLAGTGYAIFGVGVEAIGITATKAIVKWFKGKEVALALGLNVATARIGTLLAMSVSPLIAAHYQNPSSPLLYCIAMLIIGLLSFLVFCIMDKKLEKEDEETEESSKEEFKLSDILGIVKLKGFWYIAALCVLFYSAVFPFLKYASDLMVQKFSVNPELAGIIPSLLPLGTLFLTPFFGNLYDRKGKGASIMIIGSLMLIGVHLLFSIPFLNYWLIAVVLMIILGIAFSLVPSAMWPSVPKIIDERRLGTAYSLIFWIQNWGLMGVPLLIGRILDSRFCLIGETMINGKLTPIYNYTLPMLVFAGFGILGLLFAFLLKKEDKKKGYGLELPNIEK